MDWGVSAISIEDGDWCDNGIQENEINELASAVSCGKQSAISGFKSKAFMMKSIGNNAPNNIQKSIHTNKALNLEYILCSWTDLFLNKRVSVHFRVESGINAHKSYLTRVSTSGYELVVEREMSEDSLDSVSSLLIEFVPDGNNVNVDDDLEKIVQNNSLIRVHTKLLAYNETVESITRRN